MGCMYTIDDFWSRRIPRHQAQMTTPPKGWVSGPDALSTFVEAPLTKNLELTGDVDPNKSPVILVSAPGAVGKSTLARQISSRSGGIYIDLSISEPVGGNSLSGGLYKSGLINEWADGSVTAFIDGLDEARLRVTQEAFEAFLRDVAHMARARAAPVVMFGRTGAIQDTWILLSTEIDASVLEIGYYNSEMSLKFAMERVKSAIPDSPHHDTCRRAVEALLGKLRSDTVKDRDRFAGYAPVLQVVADRVARERNPIKLISEIEDGQIPVTLQSVIDAILNREQSKLSNLTFEDETLLQKLYTPNEQIERLVSRIYRTPSPEFLTMSPGDQKTYQSALSSWVPEHPFLDGSEGTASAVFEAVLVAAALRKKEVSDVALRKELARGPASNPFLPEFYFSTLHGTYLQAEHVGIIYSAYRARLGFGDSADLSFEGAEDDDSEALAANVEISMFRNGSVRPISQEFESDQAGVLYLGSYVQNVEIFATHSKVHIGGTREVILGAPISIQCRDIQIDAQTIVVEALPSASDNAIHLEAERADVAAVNAPPIIRGEVNLSVSWPGSSNYPWTSFSSVPTVDGDPRIEEALRRFRKFVIAFRSHSKGSLKRYAAKLEHARMTKGTGKLVLAHLVRKRILTKDGNMYTLHADLLSKETGASYATSVARSFSLRAVIFVKDALLSNID